MKKACPIFLFVSIVLVCSVFAIRINEIMYNPAGDDNNREYIEIYSEELINFSGFVISDGDSNDSLKQIKSSSEHYSLIVEDGYNFSDVDSIEVSVYSIGASIGNGLSEDDTLTFYNLNKETADFVNIDKKLGNGNNKSMSFYNNSWIEFEPTPGFENKKEEMPILNNSQNNNQSNISENNTQNINNQTNIINQTEPIINQTEINQTTINQTIINQTISNNTIYNNTINISITVNSTINNNISSNTNNSINVFNKTDNSCDITITIVTEKDKYENNEKILFYNKLNYNKIEYTIEYWIEDSNGKILKNKVQTSNQNKKSYTPKKSIEGEITLKAKINYLLCNDTNLTNNYFEKAILIEEENKDDETDEEKKTEETTSKNKTKLKYELITFPEKIKANESFEIEIKITNEDKVNEFEISSYIYKDSKCYSDSREGNKIIVSLEKGEIKTIKLNDMVMSEANGTYNLKVKIRKNSQKTFKELKEQIEILKEQEKTEETGKEILKKEQSQEVLSSKKNINSENPLGEITEEQDKEDTKTIEKEISYESSSEKLKRNINYLILAVSATVTLVTVWKYERKGDKGKD